MAGPPQRDAGVLLVYKTGRGGPGIGFERTPVWAKGASAWRIIAKRRAVAVLTKRIAANIRQLEIKICESGPPHLRPQPDILSQALGELMQEGMAMLMPETGRNGGGEDRRFYTLPRYYPEPARTRLRDLLVEYRLHRWLTITHKEYCANVLEEIVRASFAAARGYNLLGLNIPREAPLDGVYKLGSITIGLEVKNTREWIYPMSDRVWIMLKKCLEIDALPLLVPRKVSFPAYDFFLQLGIFSFEFHRQVFSPLVQHLLPRIQHTDVLGYKDVIAVNSNISYPPLVTFLDKTLPRYLDERIARWQKHHALLVEYAITKGLGETKMSSEHRHRYWPEIRAAVYRDSPPN